MMNKRNTRVLVEICEILKSLCPFKLAALEALPWRVKGYLDVTDESSLGFAGRCKGQPCTPSARKLKRQRAPGSYCSKHAGFHMLHHRLKQEEEELVYCRLLRDDICSAAASVSGLWDGLEWDAGCSATC